jgi:hypothetical protein
MSGGKNSKAHFVWKCGLCTSSLHHFTVLSLINFTGKRESSAKFEPSIVPYSNENGQFAPLLVLDCRGLEFTGFDPRVIVFSLADIL